MSRIHDALRRAERLKQPDQVPSMDILADVEINSVLPESAAPTNGTSLADTAVADPLLQPVVTTEVPTPLPIIAETDFTRVDGPSDSLGFVDGQFKQPTWAAPDSNALFFVQPEQSHQLEREQFRTLRSRLYQIRANQPIKTILISSALPGEGKTFVAANLALVMGRQQGRRVLLIDGDLRKPALSQILGAPDSPGLAEYLAGQADISSVIQKAPISNLCFVPSGKRASNPVELIGNGRLGKLIEIAGTMFDWIILDSPPAVGITDASLIAEACDGVLLVVQASSTGFDVAKKACTEFRRKPVLGVVLNRADASTSYGGYYYRDYGKTAQPDSNKS
jgi:protein-tyrosine kinase